MTRTQTFYIVISDNENDDYDDIDAEQLLQWITEHRPHHDITVQHVR